MLVIMIEKARERDFQYFRIGRKKIRTQQLFYAINLLIYCCCITSNGTAIQMHSVFVNEPVLIRCNTTSMLSKQWKFDDLILFYNKVCVDVRCSQAIDLDDGYSLFIRSVSLIDEGTYECTSGSSVITRYHLIVEGLSLF